jgi:hypothetical protein
MQLLARQTRPVPQASPSPSVVAATHDCTPEVASQAVTYVLQAFAPEAGTQAWFGTHTGGELPELPWQATVRTDSTQSRCIRFMYSPFGLATPATADT